MAAYISFLYKNRKLLYNLNNVLNCALIFKSVVENHFSMIAICGIIFVSNLYAYSKIDNMAMEK